MANHWNENDFLNRIYGVGREDGHLEGCPACRAEWDSWLVRRRDLLGEPEIPAALLAQQRRQIHARIEQPRRAAWMRWSPALAATALVAIGLTAWGPWNRSAQQTEVPVLAQNTVSDSQLMTEIYNAAYETEPDVLPVRNLFEGREQ